MTISGAARLTSHGSASAVGAVTGPDGTTAGAGAAAAGVVTDGPGVFETVESLEPHPATASVATQITTAHFTIGHRTETGHGDWAGRTAGRRRDGH